MIYLDNAATALNIVLHGIIPQGGHVIITSMEHNSVLRPLRALEKSREVELSIAWGNKLGQIEPDCIKRLIKRNTCLIECTLSSNVNGTVMPVEDIGRIAGENNINFLLDASQGAGSISVDVEKMNIAFLAFPGHKGLLGPQGTGGLYIKEGIKVAPLLQGGTGSFSSSLEQPEMMPDSHESGTLNVPGIVGLKSGIMFINRLGLLNLQLFKSSLLNIFYKEIKNIKGVKIYSCIPEHGSNSGILAINIGDFDSSEIAEMLDKKYNIAVRGGFHCAPLAHKTLGTENRGLVRFSLGCFNTIEEIEYAIKAVYEISKCI